MTSRPVTVLFLIAIMSVAAMVCSAQTDASNGDMFGRRNRKSEEPKGVNEMLAKQRLKREKQDYEEMLKRGDDAVLLSQQLENSFAQNNSITSKDRQKLDALEKLVTRIRKDLGGDDDEGEETVSEKTDKPLDLQDAFKYLQSTTVKLVDELKKTTRFSISAAAIHSTNSVLKLVRFLRLRK